MARAECKMPLEESLLTALTIYARRFIVLILVIVANYSTLCLVVLGWRLWEKKPIYFWGAVVILVSAMSILVKVWFLNSSSVDLWPRWCIPHNAVLRLLRFAVENKQPAIRQSGISVMRRLGEQSLSLLQELAIVTKSCTIRMEAAKILSNAGKTDIAIRILKEVLSCITDDESSSEVFDALARMNAAALIPAFEELAMEGPSYEVRFQAVRMLGKAGATGAAIRALMQLPTISRGKTASLQLVEALGQMGGTDLSVRALIALLETTRHHEVRLQIAKTFAEIGETELSINILRWLAKIGGKNEELQVVEALAQIGEAAIMALTLLMKTSETEQVRRLAAGRLDEMKGSELSRSAQ